MEQLAAGDEAGGGVGYEEDDYHKSAEGLDDLGLVTEAACKEVGDGYSADLDRVAAQTLCDEQPVEVCADYETDSGPARLCDAAEECKTRNAHEQPCAHVGGFGGQRRDQRSEASAAEVELRCAGLVL